MWNILVNGYAVKNKKSFCANAGNPLSTCVVGIGGGVICPKNFKFGGMVY